MIEPLGRTITCKVTGLEGVVVGRAEYLTGCVQLLIQPKVKDDNSYANGIWVDEPTVDISNVERIIFPVSVFEDKKDSEFTVEDVSQVDDSAWDRGYAAAKRNVGGPREDTPTKNY